MHNTGIIILAAGSSSRLGRPKQLLLYQDKTLVENVADEAQAAKLFPIIVVTGASAEQVSLILNRQAVEIVHNTNWSEGMASGIVAGVRKIGDLACGTNDVIIAVCDQPFVSSTLFTKLIEKRAISGKEIVACAYAGTVGTPVLFASCYFNALLSLEGEEGAKKILKLYAGNLAIVPFPQGKTDIDTIEDYKNLTGQSVFSPLR